MSFARGDCLEEHIVRFVAVVFCANVISSGLYGQDQISAVLKQDVVQEAANQQLFADDFNRDSRDQYQVVGEVEWKDGRLDLGENVAVYRSVGGSTIGEVSIKTGSIPNARKFKVELIFNNNHWIHIHIDCSKRQVQRILITETLFGADDKPKLSLRPVREIRPKDIRDAERWSIRFHYGLLQIRSGERVAAVAHVKDLRDMEYLTVVGVTSLQASLPIEDFRLEGQSTPQRFSDDERRRLRNSAELGSQAAELCASRRYSEAGPLDRKALALATELLGEGHPFSINARFSLASTLTQAQDPAAIAVFDKCIELSEKSLGTDHPRTALFYSSAAAALASRWDPEAAKRLLVKSIGIYKNVLGSESMEVARTTSSLAGICRDLGRFQEALDHYLAVEGIYERTRDVPASAKAELLERLLIVASEAGKIELAIDYGTRALAMFAKGEYKNDLLQVNVLCELGAVAQMKGDRKRTSEFYKRALSILDLVPDTVRARADSYVYTGAGFLDLERYADAKTCYTKARHIYAASYGARSIPVARTALLLGGVELAQSKYDGARKHYEEAFAIQIEFARDLLPALSDSEAFNYVTNGLDARDLLLHVYDCMGKRVLARDQYQAVWASKGFVSDVIRRRREVRFESPELSALHENLQAVRRRLAAVALRNRPGGSVSADDYSDLSANKERIERQIAAKIGSAGDNTHEPLFDDWLRIVPPGVVIVDFVRTFSSRHSAVYRAYILRRNAEDSTIRIDVVHLGPAQRIDLAIASWRAMVEQGRTSSPRPDDQREGTLRAVVWEPIEPHLGDCKTLIILPDGDLSRIPWSALPGNQPDQYLIDDYAIATATSARSLMRALEQSPTISERLLLVGDIDYGTIHAVNDSVASRETNPQQRGITTWEAINGSTDEIEQVRLLWSKTSSEDTLDLATSENATESFIMQKLSSARFAHFSTHGFFAGTDYRSAFVPRREASEEQLDDSPRTRNPLVRSGLVLSSANELRFSWGVDYADGILSAEEIANVAFNDCELVVLSACETAVGPIATGEGVFGLQRAFAIGGVRTTIGSLWKVNDAATEALMNEFYANLWTRKMGKLEALREAQRTMIARYDPTQKELMPQESTSDEDDARPSRRLPARYWAAFVLSGDWK